jgi:hypothetical protein
MKIDWKRKIQERMKRLWGRLFTRDKDYWDMGYAANPHVPPKMALELEGLRFYQTTGGKLR